MNESPEQHIQPQLDPELQRKMIEQPADDAEMKTRRPACPVCGGHLIEIRAKLQCAECHTICETCCEGGPG